MFLQRKREQADVRMTDIPIPAWAESGPSNEPISLVFLHGIGGGKKGFQPSLVFFFQARLSGVGLGHAGLRRKCAVRTI